MLPATIATQRALAAAGEQHGEAVEERQRRERGEIVLAEERRLASSGRDEPHDADQVRRDREEEEHVDDASSCGRVLTQHGGAEPEGRELDHLRRPRRTPSTRSRPAHEDERAERGRRRGGGQSSRGSPASDDRPDRDDRRARQQDVARDDRGGRARRTRRSSRGWSRARTRQTASRHEQQGEARRRAVGARGPFALSARTTPAYDSPMRVVFLTGIWPPDVGGPATHGPDFAALPRDRGHSVHVVTMGDAEPSERPVPVESIARGRPFVVRYPLVAATGFRLARRADVVYATATYAAAAVAAAAPAARREARLGPRLRARPALRPLPRDARGLPAGIGPAARDAQAPAHRLAAAAPSASSSRAATSPRSPRGGASTAARVEVLVNPAPPPPDVAGRAARARDIRLRRPPDRAEGAAGRFSRRCGRSRARSCVVVGDGPERERLTRSPRELEPRRAASTFAGARPRDEVLRYLARRDVPPFSRARGRTCRMPPSKRWPSGRPSSRPRSAVSRRSSMTRRTGCSCRRTTPRRSPARSRRCSTTTSCGRGSPRPRSRRSRRSAATPIYTRLERDPAGGGSRDAAGPLRRARPARRSRSRRGSPRNGMRSPRCSTVRVLNAGHRDGRPAVSRSLPERVAGFYPRCRSRSHASSAVPARRDRRRRSVRRRRPRSPAARLARRARR